MKKIFLYISFVAFCFTAFAETDDRYIMGEIIQAINLAQGTGGKIDRPKAFGLLQKHASAGNAKAMNALGLMYILGHTAEPDTAKALYWLNLAADNGYSLALDNLGIVYKYARGGVTMDLKKSFYYFERSALDGSLLGQYHAGYMLYKGLGCTQNYEKAFEYFTESARQNYSPSMYMLGLCYRNGYGTPRNAGDANYWLAAADERAYTPATDEIERETPENSESRMKIRSEHAVKIPEQFTRIKGSALVQDIDGSYEGILVTYDWSGQHVISETPVSLALLSSGNTVEGVWTENGDTVMLQASREGGTLRFIDTRQYRSDHYADIDGPVLFNFENAEMQTVESEGGISLNGNLTMFSPHSMEPERPMYLSLRRVSAAENGINNIGSEAAAAGGTFRAYPVPFAGELNLSFTHTGEGKVQTGIYDFAGACLLLYDAGTLPAGEQRLTLDASLPAGIYIVKLFTTARTEQAVIVSKGQRQ